MAISEKVLRAVNDEPRLQSILYDCNMLPEQIDSSDGEKTLTLAVACYMLGKEAGMCGPMDVKKEPTRCAECDCKGGGADCNWIPPKLKEELTWTRRK